jgi:hypothetical protein
LLIYFSKVYKFTYYQSVFILTSAIAVTGVWLTEVAAGYWRWDIFTTALFMVMMGFSVSFLLFSPKLISSMIGTRKISVQTLLNKLEG